MNWVAPIKDDETLEKFKEALKEIDIKYYIMFEIGVGTGLQLQDILALKVKDIREKDEVVVFIGTKNVRSVFRIEPELKQIIMEYTEGKDPESYVIQGFDGSNLPLSREQAYRVFKTAGKKLGLVSIGTQTMRKTFAWRYYNKTKDIYYIQNMLNHASPSITYRYIGEKPNVEVVLRKMTPEENARSRQVLFTNGAGKKRIEKVRDLFIHLETELENPSNNDAFYGKVDCLLTEVEELIRNYTEK